VQIVAPTVFFRIFTAQNEVVGRKVIVAQTLTLQLCRQRACLKVLPGA
jgi:hypothetical protein